ncbi:hypothetical protein V8J82_22995 [Gymnodinialimonas sp. 2305UL16-5]|uniref:hypothetical protein n=1 Tax=Gymnodinialimonas mytili TaxID=3126503 RepID=UPI0030A75102
MTFRTFLLAQAFGIAAFNVAINSAYTSYLWGAEQQLALGEVSADLAMTPIWIGLLSVLLGTFFIRKAFADGTMLRDAGITSHPVFSRLPRNVLPRSVVVAVLCAIAFALPLFLALPLIGDGVLTPVNAIGTKAIITLLFSLLIVPLIVYATTADVVQ